MTTLLAARSAADLPNRWRGSWAFIQAFICHLLIHKNSRCNRRSTTAISWSGGWVRGGTKPPKRGASYRLNLPPPAQALNPGPILRILSVVASQSLELSRWRMAKGALLREEGRWRMVAEERALEKCQTIAGGQALEESTQLSLNIASGT